MKNLTHRSFFAARFGYYGEHFYGVQAQPHLKTVLGTLEECLMHAAEAPIMGLAVSARTDRGVHALMNFATFWVRKPFCEEAFLKQINSSCQNNLWGLQVYPISQNIHARKAVGKIYRYLITENAAHENPFAWNIAVRLELLAMQEALKYLVGTKDFSSLRGGGCSASSPVKTIYTVKISRIEKNTIAIDIHGDAFLRRMVRNLVGLLIEIGAGLRKPEDVLPILDAKNRLAAGICAPAQGLTLMKVFYPDLENLYASS